MDDKKRYSLVQPPEAHTRFHFGDDAALCAPDRDQAHPQAHPVGSDQGGGPKKIKPIRFFVAGVCIVLVACACFLAYVAFFHKDEGALQPDPNVKVGTLTGASADLDKIAEEAQVSFSINAAPEFETGTAPGNLTIENLEINNNRFTVAINLEEDGREVYRSGYLDPGQYIESAPLSEDLPPGDYPAVATIETFRLSDNTPIGRVAAELVLHVKG